MDGSNQKPTEQLTSTTDVTVTTNNENNATPEKTNDGSMSIIAHLTELRKRLIRCLIAIGIGSGIAYYYVDDIMEVLTRPVGKLYYMQPAEAFFTYIKIAIFAGFLLALPVVLYQIWKFILPALIGSERFIVTIIVPCSLVLFLAGVAFSFFLVLPAGVKFLLGFSTSELQPLFSLKQYFDFVISFLIPFGFIFEVPLAIVILAKIGIINSKFLVKQQRIVLFLTFVIGAIISPSPDVFSQSMIAVPMILLYEISLVIVKYILKK